MTTDDTDEPAWPALGDRPDFGFENLPYGVFSHGQSGHRRVGVRLGEHVLDVARLPVPHATQLDAPTLNPFMALGRAAWAQTRLALQELLKQPDTQALIAPHRHRRTDVVMHLPVDVADYVDFYSSEHHAENLGRMFRPGSPPLPSNWKHLPVGYHGRAGTVAVSGTPLLRPSGQRVDRHGDVPVFGPTRRLDIEAEIGFLVGVPTEPGQAVPVGGFADHVFGACVVNDWSARDLQSWEYTPLGPFLGKSFLTSIGPWVVPLAALEPARTAPPARHPQPLSYLLDGDEPWGLDIALEVRLNGEVVSRPPFKHMYWTPAQQLAHMTVNGARLRTGDLFASGTVSGPARDQRGSLIELTWNGTEPLALPDGSERTFLQDGDEVTVSASAVGARGTRIGFGSVSGQVLPANRFDPTGSGTRSGP